MRKDQLAWSINTLHGGSGNGVVVKRAGGVLVEWFRGKEGM